MEMKEYTKSSQLSLLVSGSVEKKEETKKRIKK